MSKTNMRLLLRFDCSMASMQQGTNLRGKMILTKKKKKRQRSQGVWEWNLQSDFSYSSPLCHSIPWVSSNVIKGVAITTLINYSGISCVAVKSQATVVLFYVIASGVRQEVYDTEIKHSAVITKKGQFLLRQCIHIYPYVLVTWMTLKNTDTFHTIF